MCSSSGTVIFLLAALGLFAGVFPVLLALSSSAISSWVMAAPDAGSTSVSVSESAFFFPLVDLDLLGALLLASGSMLNS
ncbi:hypothetical protein IWZ03DRAFT_370822 [Phyllosticta citriasiana]|uniref:Secreted peptide n=1 Tax=Phyllosticta citriasiana TaxID=595635 RepID=A0ABR1KVT6_9PEZI